MKKKRTIRQRIDDTTFELNLAPMLDMMVALVPFLLLSVVFVKLVVIESQVPQPVAQAIERDKNNEDRKVSFKIHIEADKSLKIDIVEARRTRSILVTPKEEFYDLATLHEKMVELKKQYSDVFSLELFPKEGVIYKDIVAIMDELRQSKNAEDEFYIVDKDSNEKTPTRIMFPNIVFGNIIEG